jgi:transposase InsO family protein
MCAVLNISPKTYYKYRSKEDPDYYDYLIIKEVFDDSKGTYGYRRIVEGLKIKYEITMNGKKVLRIMKKYNLMPEYVRKEKKKNKNERIEDNVKPNLLNRNFNTDASNKVWDTDITYLIFKGSRAYLSTIIDLYDRKVVSYKISKKNNNKLVMDTLNMTALFPYCVVFCILAFVSMIFVKHGDSKPIPKEKLEVFEDMDN